MLGPLMWCLVFDSLLDQLTSIDSCEPIAFADDLVVVVTGSSRVQLELNGQTAIRELEKWCALHKMVLSQSKTVTMLLKGKLNQERPPRVFTSAGPIKFKTSFKYLGIMIDRNFKFNSHPNYVAEKAKHLMQKYSKLCRLKWGVPYKKMSTIYKGAFVPVITYGSYAWIDQTNDKTRRKIISAHRCALIRITKSYKTTSTVALEVLAGIQPITHEIQIDKLRYCIRKQLPCHIYGKQYSTNEQDARSPWPS